jgi:hypothetical protein
MVKTPGKYPELICSEGCSCSLETKHEKENAKGKAVSLKEEIIQKKAATLEKDLC